MLLLPCVLGAPARAEDTLDALSLEELMQVEVTSVSGKSESLQDAAAAVFVLSRQDLRRSGATNLPDALRQVPGLQVARIDATKWAVSARGFNGRFANKLLVLLDGRQLYSPYFSGVFWDEQHVPFDLIERIEIIRGPGATIWGANAVNGVINIITRNADAVSGTEVELSGGNRGSYSGYARQAGQLGSEVDYRVYASAMAADPTKPAFGSDDDDLWRDMQMGMRVDWQPSNQDTVSLQAQVRHGNCEENMQITAVDPLRVQQLSAHADARGGYLTAHWDHAFEAGAQLALHAHYDYSDRTTELYELALRNYELGARYRVQAWDVHDVVLGASYRYAEVPLAAGNNSTLLPGSDSSAENVEAFVQDEIALTDELALIVGGKLEHTESTGWAPQPNVRLAWRTDFLGVRGTFWGAVSRAVRTPSQGENEFAQLLVPLVLPAGHPANPTPLPLGIALAGNDDLDAERLLAYELGWRGTMSGGVSASISVYRHEYEDLVQSRIRGLTCEPSGTQVALNPACLFSSTHVITRTDVTNNGSATERGLEMDVAWALDTHLSLAAQLTVRDVDIESTGAAGAAFGAAYGPGDPQWLASTQLVWQPTDAVELNLDLRHVDAVDKYDIDAYTTADVRLAWRPTPAIHLELLGANLLQASHREYASELGDIGAGRIERTALARITWTR